MNKMQQTSEVPFTFIRLFFPTQISFFFQLLRLRDKVYSNGNFPPFLLHCNGN